MTTVEEIPDDALPTRSLRIAEAAAEAYYISDSKISGTGPSGQRGLFARRALGPGESLGVFRRALVTSLEARRLVDTCANCFVWTEGAATGTRLYVSGATRVSKCGGCQRVRYCSKVRL